MESEEFIDYSLIIFEELNQLYKNKFIITYLDLSSYTEQLINLHMMITDKNTNKFVKLIVNSTNLDVLLFENNLNDIIESIIQDLISQQNNIQSRLNDLEFIFKKS